MSSPSKLVDLRRTSDEPRRVVVKNARPQREDPAPRPRKPLRKKRRDFRVAIAAFCAFLLGVAIYGVHVVSYLPRYTIQTIEIEGVKEIPPAVIVTYVDSILHPESRPFIARANVLAYGPDAIANSIMANFPRVARARVTRASAFSTTLTIRIDERRSYALFCGASCYTMDERGYIYAESTIDTHTDTGYIFSGGATTSPTGTFFAEGHFAALVLLVKHLNDEGFAPRGVALTNDKDFIVPLGAGFSLKASFGEDADVLIRNLRLVLASDALKTGTSTLDYIDLRFGDRVYFKLKSESQSEPVLQ